MEGEKNMCSGGNCSASCACGKMHGGCHGGKYYVLKKIVMLIVLLVVFWFGTQLGELRALMRYSHYGHGSMMMGSGMMNNGTASTTPVTGQ